MMMMMMTMTMTIMMKEKRQKMMPMLFFSAGIFFVLPCIDTYTKVDLRTVSFDVPPQEV